jgi:hypothetical protein
VTSRRRGKDDRKQNTLAPLAVTLPQKNPNNSFFKDPAKALLKEINSALKKILPKQDYYRIPAELPQISLVQSS